MNWGIKILKNKTERRSFFQLFSNNLIYDPLYKFPKVYIFKMVYMLNIPLRGIMKINATFNNITRRSVLLVEETQVPRENNRPTTNKWQTLSHLRCIEYISPWAGFKLTMLVMICTDCAYSCTSNYHVITTTAPVYFYNPTKMHTISRLCFFLYIMLVWYS